MPTYRGSPQTLGYVTLEEASYEHLAEMWRADLILIQDALLALRPWYLKLWDWWHGR